MSSARTPGRWKPSSWRHHVLTACATWRWSGFRRTPGVSSTNAPTAWRACCHPPRTARTSIGTGNVGRFLYRQPPYDLPLLQWRLLQELLPGPNVWWPYRAVFEYPMAERLVRLEQPVLVLAPHDDLWEQTERVFVSGGLPPRAHFRDLPHLGLDIAYYATDEVFRLVSDFLATSSP